MDKTLITKINYGIAIAVVTLFFLFLAKGQSTVNQTFQLSNPEQSGEPVLGGSGSTAITTDLVGSSSLFYSVATSTATSTSNSLMVGVATDFVDLYICANASSTTSNIKWQNEFSFDGSTWYAEDVKSTAGSLVTHQAASTTHSWIPGTTATVCKNVGITNMNSEFYRIKVFRGANASTAANNFSVWVKGVAKAL